MEQNWVIEQALVCLKVLIFATNIPCSTSHKSTKNVSKDFVVKHVEIDLYDKTNAGVNNLGATFSKSKKEKGYLMTNSSSITNLHSYKTLDIPDRVEVKPFPNTKGNQ